jgi:hypothetical protein
MEPVPPSERTNRVEKDECPASQESPNWRTRRESAPGPRDKTFLKMAARAVRGRSGHEGRAQAPMTADSNASLPLIAIGPSRGSSASHHASGVAWPPAAGRPPQGHRRPGGHRQRGPPSRYRGPRRHARLGAAGRRPPSRAVAPQSTNSPSRRRRRRSDYVNHPRRMAYPTARAVETDRRSHLGQIWSRSGGSHTPTIAENELNRGVVTYHGGEREIGGIVGELVEPMELST